MNIVVLSGGISTEREVSIKTGAMVCHALRKKGHRAIIIDVFMGLDGYKADQIFEEDYDVDRAVENIRSMNQKAAEIMTVRKQYFGDSVIEVCEAADIVFMALHGENGENGKLQAAFDLYGIKYTGTGYLGSALAMDKGYSRQLFGINGIPIAKGFTLTKGMNTDLTAYEMVLPCVVKPCCGGSSIGVFIAETDEAYQKAIKDGFAYEDSLIIESYIKGREFSVGIIDDKALPIIEIAPIEGFYDYTNKYEPGKTLEVCPAELDKKLSEEMQNTALKAAEVLSLTTYCRVDFLLDEKNNIYCLEANTLPGMTATSLLPQEAQADGMDFPALCEKLIEISLRKYKS